jgi:hypothetical protein
VELTESGRDVDGPEEILWLSARVADSAGDTKRCAAWLRRAFVEVQHKARRLHDPAWQGRYLAAAPAFEILTAAREAGLDEAPEDPS